MVEALIVGDKLRNNMDQEVIEALNKCMGIFSEHIALLKQALPKAMFGDGLLLTTCNDLLRTIINYDNVPQIALSPNGKLIARGYDNRYYSKSVHISRMADGQDTALFRYYLGEEGADNEKDSVDRLLFSPDSMHLISISKNGAMKVCNFWLDILRKEIGL